MDRFEPVEKIWAAITAAGFVESDDDPGLYILGQRCLTLYWQGMKVPMVTGMEEVGVTRSHSKTKARVMGRIVVTSEIF